LAFALSQPLVDVVLVGVDSIANLLENLDIAGRVDEFRGFLSRLVHLEQRDENILLPMNWKT
jgi:predicted aldo/keto reductase-like oxidoreductase